MFSLGPVPCALPTDLVFSYLGSLAPTLDAEYRGVANAASHAAPAPMAAASNAASHCGHDPDLPLSSGRCQCSSCQPRPRKLSAFQLHPSSAFRALRDADVIDSSRSGSVGAGQYENGGTATAPTGEGENRSTTAVQAPMISSLEVEPEERPPQMSRVGGACLVTMAIAWHEPLEITGSPAQTLKALFDNHHVCKICKRAFTQRSNLLQHKVRERRCSRSLPAV
jgi:hypothetical protein